MPTSTPARKYGQFSTSPLNRSATCGEATIGNKNTTREAKERREELTKKRLPRVRSVRRRMKGRVASSSWPTGGRVVHGNGSARTPRLLHETGRGWPSALSGFGKEWEGRPGEGFLSFPRKRGKRRYSYVWRSRGIYVLQVTLWSKPNHAELITFAPPVTEKLCRLCCYRATNLVWVGRTVLIIHSYARKRTKVGPRKQVTDFIFQTAQGIPINTMVNEIFEHEQTGLSLACGWLRFKLLAVMNRIHNVHGENKCKYNKAYTMFVTP
jgi:hypothetical protein